MEAIAVEIGFVARLPASGIEREAFDHIFCHLVRQTAFARDDAQTVKGGIACGSAIKRLCSPFSDQL